MPFDLVDDQTVDDFLVVPGNTQHRNIETEVAHHMRRRSLDRCAADDRRYRDLEGGRFGQGVTDVTDGENRRNADERIRRAEHDQIEAGVGERGKDLARCPGAHSTREIESGYLGLGAEAHEIVLERVVSARLVARSWSPSRNHVGPPRRSSISMKPQVSFARPQPNSGLAMPARV